MGSDRVRLHGTRVALAGLLLVGVVHCGKESASPGGDTTAGEPTGGSAEMAGASTGGSRATGGSRSLGGSGGGDAAAGASGTSPDMVDQCSTPTAADYKPQWTPPKATPGACTKQQIEQEYSLCEGASLNYSQ